ncbi:MAG: RNA methyltransferase [Nitrospirae bacterium]|nr:RNA methyltransferase [Nitrospirota bacterium]
MGKIESLSNPLIKDALSIKNLRSKYKHEAFIIEGPHLIEMAVNARVALKRVFITEEFAREKKYKKLLDAEKLGTEIFEVNEGIFKKLSDTETPQGILAIASYKPKGINDITFKKQAFVVISDGIQEPGNLGALIRTSDAVGADTVIVLPGSCDIFMGKTLRASAGSIFNIRIVYADVETLLRWIMDRGIKLIITYLKAGQSIYDADLTIPLAFVFGNEAKGVRKRLRESSSLALKIPIYGKAESLNVGVSAGICLYEARRQRLK